MQKYYADKDYLDTDGNPRFEHVAVYRADEVAAVVLKYGYHQPECDFIQGTLPCSCGWEALRCALMATESQP